MKATPAEQRRLLDLAGIDAQIRQADEARRNPPQAARVKDLLAQRHTLSAELTTLLGTRDDAKAELARIESDVAVVDARSARDAGRLATTSNPKDAQALEHEIASLAKRKSDLEDAELDIMERLESADAAVAAQEALIAVTNDEGGRLSTDAKSAVAEATTKFEAATRDRAAVAGGVPAPLLALYDRVAVRTTGAGLLRRRTCEGCYMELSGTDLNTIAQTSDDDVVTCPECGCILVRTAESGLPQ